MKEDKSHLLNYAMYGGLYLGLFWIFKYLLIIGSEKIPELRLVSSVLGIGTFLILFYFLVKYKTEQTNNQMGYWHGVQFGIMLFFFASILEALIVYIHIVWIDPTFVANLYENMIDMAKSLNIGSELVENLEKQTHPSPVTYIFNNVMMGDVFIGILLSLITVPIVRSIKKRV